MDYRVMKHVHPGDNMNDDWVSVLDLGGSDWHTLRASLAVQYNQLLRTKQRLAKVLKKNPNAKTSRSPSELAMEMADVKMLYDKVAQAFPPPAKPVKS